MKLILGIICIIATVNCVQVNKKLNVAVYYEVLCPYCKKFVTKQAFPAWKSLSDGFELTLVPYGKAITRKVNGKWKFTCQHGPKECYGNKVQGCILKNTDMNFSDKMELINCILMNSHPESALDNCADNLNIKEKSKINTCANSKEGGEILAEYGNITAALDPKLPFVPLIIIDGKFDEAIDEEATDDLKGVICRLATIKPSHCD